MGHKAVLTGSTGGLGQEVAKLLAGQGWNLIFLNRNEDKSEEQRKAFQAEYPDQVFGSFHADLMDIREIRRASQDIAKKHPDIKAIYNIAGLLTDQRMMSKQNIEGHFAVNTVAPYAISQALIPQLRVSATVSEPAFIVNFSSEIVGKVKTLDVNTLRNPQTIGGLMDAYAKTKLALNTVGCFMKDELLEDNIYIYSADPGATKTQMTSGNKGMPFIVRLIAPFIFQDADQQARKLVEAVEKAVADKKTGLFISNGKVREHPALANDIDLQRSLEKLLNDTIQED